MFSNILLFLIVFITSVVLLWIFFTLDPTESSSISNRRSKRKRIRHRRKKRHKNTSTGSDTTTSTGTGTDTGTGTGTATPMFTQMVISDLLQNALVIFNYTDTGDVPPIRSISGDNTQLDRPFTANGDNVNQEIVDVLFASSAIAVFP